MNGAHGAAEAKRRFSPQTSAQRTADLATRAFVMEDLLAGHGAVGLARAAANQGNRSAQQALSDLRRSITALERDAANGGDAA
jgi:hypothetical protein